MQKSSYLDYHSRINETNEDKETKRSLLTLSNQLNHQEESIKVLGASAQNTTRNTQLSQREG